MEFPFDTIKVRLQTQPILSPGTVHDTSKLSFKGPLDCFKKSIEAEGIKGLYKGLSSPLIGSMAENAILFVAYNHFQSIIRDVSNEGKPFDPNLNTRPLTIPELCLAGALSGATVSFLLTPIELIKCKLQVQDVGLVHTKSRAIHKSTGTIKTTGITKSSPSSSSSSPSSSSSLSASLGFTSSTPAATATQGLNKIATPFSSFMESSSKHPHPHPHPHPYSHQQYPHQYSHLHHNGSVRPIFTGPLSVVIHAVRQGGIAGLYRGHFGTVLRETGGGAAWFGVYELCCRALTTRSGVPVRSKSDLTAWELMGAGALAGMSYNAALFPADVIKSRQQTTDEDMRGGGGRRSNGFYQVAKEVYRGEGIKGFFRGFGITIARSAPTSAVIFVTYVRVYLFSNVLLFNRFVSL